MKNILKITVPFLFCLVFLSCTNDKDTVASSNGFELRKDAIVVSPSVLLYENNSDLFTILKWDRSNNGVPTESKYSIVISDHDADPNFQYAVESTVGLVLLNDARRDTLKVNDFNTLINQLPSFNCNEMNIDVRIKSKLGVSTNAIYQYSNAVTFAVKGYSKSKPILAFAQNLSSADSSSKLSSSDYTIFNDYEGYMYLEPGTYKFYKPDSCGEFSNPTVYGLSGTNTGSLVLDGSSGFVVATAGHYYVKANLSDSGSGSLTYSIAAFNATTNTFGVFGKALRPTIGSANTTPMNYDPTTKKWSVTVDMVNGLKFGFKTSSTAPIASLEGTGVGTFTESPLKTITSGAPTDGSIKAPGDFVDNTTKTKYAIEVDLSKPRNYTYKLTVVPN